ncbi:MAG: phosphoribosylformylglycinamidine synthase subunit PurQ [Gammaproteobacteria bacterium]
MKIAIIQFPGSTGLRDVQLAVLRAGMEPVDFFYDQPLDCLDDMQGYVLIGGFSFDDEPRAGVIAALQPVMLALAKQSERGLPILGIGNGAQILVESGLVPGLENNKKSIALVQNKRMFDGKLIGHHAYNTNLDIKLSADYQRNAFTHRLTKNDILNLPIASAEGRFVMSDALLQEIQINGLNVFQYCDEMNNGSRDNIAAISNKAGNVMAMMPHPERTPAGDVIFLSMRHYIKSGYREVIAPLNYYPRQYQVKPYVKPAAAFEIVLDTAALRHKSDIVNRYLQMNSQCFRYFEVYCESERALQQIKDSGGLFESDDRLVSVSQFTGALLVKPKDDVLGQYITQTLRSRFGLEGVLAVSSGMLWVGVAASVRPVVFNSVIEDCYQYECC